MTFNLPYFDVIDIDDLSDYYEVDTTFIRRNLQLDLNFEDSSIDELKLIPVREYLGNLTQVHNIATKAIYENYYTGEEVKEFLTFHTAELGEAELQALTANSDKNKSLEEQILMLLELRRIGFYPETEECFATLDFTISGEISQYLMVIKMNSRQEIEEITMES
jgi:hypothetical protein